jgi:hypothetical protein
LSGCNLQEFIDSYFTAIGILEANLSENTAEIDSKIEAVKRTVKDLSQKELMATELVRTGVLYQLNYFRNESAEQITGSIISRYS